MTKPIKLDTDSLVVATFDPEPAPALVGGGGPEPFAGAATAPDICTFNPFCTQSLACY